LPGSATFTTEFYPRIAAAIQHTETVLGIALGGPILIDVYTNQEQYRGRVALNDSGNAPPGSSRYDATSEQIAVNMPALLQESETAVDDTIRNSIAQYAIGQMTVGRIPVVLSSGLALYLQLPTTDYLARLAGLLDTANQNQSVNPWFDLFTLQSIPESELTLAQGYAICSFLIDRYDIPAVRAFLTALGSGANWDAAMDAAFGVDAAELERIWQAGLPAWTVNGWRDNLMASFDLQPARDLLSQGQYVSAKAVLGPAQNLYRQLDDTEQLAEVQLLIAQADTGIQAEALMTEIEAALRAFDYARASNLLDQAEIQFAFLPSEQVPTSVLETYRGLSERGTQALGQLETANRLADSWGRYPEAREAAQEAGSTFAQLGDEDRRAEAAAVLDQLDNRQRRLVVLLAGLGVLTLGWLMLWLRARGPSDVVWA
jgi:hypothetical protein